jgi:hypothetical protein
VFMPVSSINTIVSFGIACVSSINAATCFGSCSRYRIAFFYALYHNVLTPLIPPYQNNQNQPQSPLNMRLDVLLYSPTAVHAGVFSVCVRLVCLLNYQSLYIEHATDLSLINRYKRYREHLFEYVPTQDTLQPFLRKSSLYAMPHFTIYC